METRKFRYVFHNLSNKRRTHIEPKKQRKYFKSHNRDNELNKQKNRIRRTNCKVF